MRAEGEGWKLCLLIDAAKQVTSVQDVTVGQGTANQPATTTLALIEQGMKVMTGIFKRIPSARTFLFHVAECSCLG
jgi:hypothetical protein